LPKGKKISMARRGKKDRYKWLSSCTSDSLESPLRSFVGFLFLDFRP
jgi:hypothetical protein